MDDTERQVASLGYEPQQSDPLKEEQVRGLQGQLETLRAKMHRMETFEKSFNETRRQLEVRGSLEAVSPTELTLASSHKSLKTPVLCDVLD